MFQLLLKPAGVLLLSLETQVLTSIHGHLVTIQEMMNSTVDSIDHILETLQIKILHLKKDFLHL